MNDEDIILKLAAAGIEAFGDQEAQYDMTSWTITAKRPNKGSWHLRGQFTNFFLDKAFDDTCKDQNEAIKIVKDQLWFAFTKCYRQEE